MQSARLGAFDIALWPTNAGDFGVSAYSLETMRLRLVRSELGLYAVLPNAQWIARMAQAGSTYCSVAF